MEPHVGFSSYDVFINFRGEDTRNKFVGHLHGALKYRGIHAFIDSKGLWKGDDIGLDLLRAIEGSKLSIAIFSERYAESKWCLWDLAHILEYSQIIFPIFFKIKTSDVKNQTGSFEISPQRYGNEVPETLRRWKDSLRAIGDKNGWVFEDGDESELVRSVVQNAWIRLNMIPLIGVKHPIGLEARIDSLSIDIARTTGGLPLPLEVLGSGLSIKKDKEVWKSMHHILEQIPHNNVYGKLKISYDNLQDDIEKAMFLDAACFFIGWEEETVISIWEACGFEPKYRIEVLNRKSLLKTDLRYGLFRKAWNNGLENKMFQQLKILKLSCCFPLSESPNFSCVPHLERLYLDDCSYLISLDESIGGLQQLAYLNLGWCYSLKTLPNSVCRLSSLEKLILTHCTSLNELPGSIGDLKESLVELSLDRTNIKALSNSVGLLKKLEVLDLSLCHGLVGLPRSLENMTSLRYIDLSGRDKLPYISMLPSSLIELRFRCKSLVSFPDMRNMRKLQLLCLKDFCVKGEAVQRIQEDNSL
ncbi:disease resistance protein Roq1-like [Macadamia integrifolia]|uniref:disease resistance protein Roq1-like n=1 Tax=Macadamia integrifolia TaxID=60698 RepID=UPI001C4ECB17|nr:disease resistance protein Roq1-like [Macadamia integrifolia]